MAKKSRKFFKHCKHCKRVTTWYEDEHNDPYCTTCFNWA